MLVDPRLPEYTTLHVVPPSAVLRMTPIDAEKYATLELSIDIAYIEVEVVDCSDVAMLDGTPAAIDIHVSPASFVFRIVIPSPAVIATVELPLDMH